MAVAWILLLLYMLPLASAQFTAAVVPIYDQNRQGSTIECPTAGPCMVQCHAVGACENATIQCPSDWYCHVSCHEESSCRGATINGPYNFGADLQVDCTSNNSCRGATINGDGGSDVSVNCFGENSCRNAGIEASKSWELRLRGCAANGGCIGMNITCPPHVDGTPRCILFFDNEFGGTVDEPLTIYAENGFLDLNMTESNSSLRHGTVYCTDDYSKSCSINQVIANQGRDEWICDTNGSSICNTEIYGFSVQLQQSNVQCESRYFLGYFYSPSSCAYDAMERQSTICNGDQIMWTDTYATDWGCYCCQDTSTLQSHLHWDVYQYEMLTTDAPTLAPTPPNSLWTTAEPPILPIPSLTPTTAPTSLPSLIPTSDPTLEPTLEEETTSTTTKPTTPYVELKDLETTITTINSDSNSEDEIVIDLVETDNPTTSIPVTDIISRDTFQWSIHYTIYALLGTCATCSMVLAIALNVYSRGRLTQIAQEEGIANLDDHPSLNPDSSKFVPGKMHPAARLDSNSSARSLEVKISVIQHTPSSMESVIPDGDPEFEGQTTGDDV